jgi:hypothetical protein
VELVKRFQPRDGTKTRAWETPDPWQLGRLFKKKADQQNVLEQIDRDDYEDEDAGLTEAENRLLWAERRRDERQALADARRRAWAMKQEQPGLQQQTARATRLMPARNGRRKSAAGNRRWDDSEVI